MNDNKTPRPVVKIDKSMKIRLLKACSVGELLPEDFPELFYVAEMSLQLMSDEELISIINNDPASAQDEKERD